MLTVSDRFRAALSRPVTLVTRLDVLHGGEVAGSLQSVAGTITVDATSPVLRTLTAEMADTPGAWELITRPGAELRAWRGLRHEGGDEAVSLGTFEVDQPSQTAASISLSCPDRSAKISRSTWYAPLALPAGMAVNTAIETILTTAWPGSAAYIELEPSDAILRTLVVYDAGEFGDPWADATSLARDYGLTLYVDPMGIFRTRLASRQGTRAWTFDGSIPAATPLSRTDQISAGAVSNGVIVIGEGSGVSAPVRGEAWDDNPASPTYHLGPYGKAPRWISTANVTTQLQAVELALVEFGKRDKGRASQVSWEQVTLPFIEPGDTVRLGNTDYTVDRMSIPLNPGQMAVTAREVRV